MNSKVSLLSLFLVSCCSGLVMSQTPPPPIKSERKASIQQAKKLNESLLNIKNYTSLTNLVESWIANLPETTRESLQGEIFWEDLHRKDKLIMEGVYPKNISHHELTIVGGRAAWVLERMLGCELPPMTESSTSNEIANLRQVVGRKLQVLDQKINEREKGLWANWVKTLGAAERLKLAGDPKTSAYALIELAKDNDVQIRRTAASNLNTPLDVILQLTKDPDQQVQRLAKDNVLHARALNFRRQD